MSPGDSTSMRYHVNGELVRAEDAAVSVRDRGFAYGDAAFETLRAYGGDVFEWEAHAERLARTCDTLGLDHGVPDDELRRRVEETLDGNDLDDAYVRLSITRGVQPGTLAPAPEVDPTVVVVVRELPRGGLDGEPVWSEPARVGIVETRHVPDESVPAAAKTHAYVNGVLARLDLDAGEDEALLLDLDGRLTEGTVSNLFFVREGTLHTPSLAVPVLPGITRSVVFDLAAEAGVPVETGRYRPADLRAADEAFLTNTTWEVRPIRAVDGRDIGGPDRWETGEGAGPITAELAARFDALVEERHY